MDAHAALASARSRPPHAGDRPRGSPWEDLHVLAFPTWEICEGPGFELPLDELHDEGDGESRAGGGVVDNLEHAVVVGPAGKQFERGVRVPFAQIVESPI